MSIFKQQLVAFCLLFAASIQPIFASPEFPSRNSIDHIIQITAKLEFDGRIIDVDELIICTGETFRNSNRLHMKANRYQVAVETIDGGMITFGTRKLCDLYESIWGDADEELTAPAGWTPILSWLDNRRSELVKEGILYVSETALNAENGRLKIIEDFALTIPQHPYSEMLFDEAETQAIERDYCLGQNEGCKALHPNPVMVELSEQDWRHPNPDLLLLPAAHVPPRDHQPLIDVLDGLEGEGIYAIPIYQSDNPSERTISLEASKLIQLYLFNRPTLGGSNFLTFLSIPKLDAERFGLLATEAALRKYERWPYALVRYDDAVPLKCEDGYLVADFDNPGLAYIYGEGSGCMDSEANRGFVWQGHGLVENWEGRNSRLFFDFRTKALWVLR